MALQIVRGVVVALSLAAVVAAVRWRRPFAAYMHRFFLEPISPVNVAALCVIVFYLITKSALARSMRVEVSMPASARRPPFGWAWLGDLPFQPDVILGAKDALVVAGVMATLGLASRLSVPIAALLAVEVFGVPNFFEKINHGHHARVLFARALALAPCGDALSLDRLYRRLRGYGAPPPSAA
jgi:hypothetical protein